MRVFATLRLAAVATVAVIAVPAFAGEVTGNDGDTPLRGASICQFSGLNDGEAPDGHTQSFGQNVRAGRNDPTAMDPDFEGPFLPHPGWSCNPNNFQPPEGD